jgi:hypothetical protein
MSPDNISNPIIHSRFEESLRHFRFSEEGINNEIVSGGWCSGHLVPAQQPKRRGKADALKMMSLGADEFWEDL